MSTPPTPSAQSTPHSALPPPLNPPQHPPTDALAITLDRQPPALLSTRNRPRSHGCWPPRRMRMATPGQARLSLVHASPCPRLLRGPSRHQELFAASTRFSIVSSV